MSNSIGFEFGNTGLVWRADSWLFISAAGGDVSLLMPEKNLLDLAHFIRSAMLHPEGANFYSDWREYHYTYDSTKHDEKTTNIMVGGDGFVYTFNMALSELEIMASYLEEHSPDAEDV